jgi:thymidylate kinase
MKLIEMTGLPGSGKTTVYPHLMSSFSDIGFDIYDFKKFNQRYPSYLKSTFSTVYNYLPRAVRSRYSKYMYSKLNSDDNFINKFKIEFNYLVDFAKTINQHRLIPDEHKELSDKWLLETASIYQVARELLKDDSYLLLDEGFTHKVINLFVSLQESEINEEGLEQYLLLIPQIEILIFIKTDINVCLERIMKRKNKNQRHGTSKAEVLRFLNIADQVLKITLKSLIKENVNVITIDNSSENLSNINSNELMDLIADNK